MDALPHPEIVLIAALTPHDRLIGKDNGLPWSPIRADLKRFSRLTRGHALVMGRRTFMSILHEFGRPLTGRRQAVLTSQGPLPDFPDIETFTSMSAALKALKNEDIIFIAGGTRPYEEGLQHADRLEITEVEGSYEGDTYFPRYEHLIGTRYYMDHKEESTGCTFCTYLRKT